MKLKIKDRFQFAVVLSIALLTLPVIIAACRKQDNLKTIYIVRHAEKDLTDPTDNPPLTSIGEERAQKLALDFKHIKIDQIYSTSYIRNMSTVAPLAAEKGITVENYTWHETSTLISTIKANEKSNILICGHGDNILPMIELLGGKSPVTELGYNEYDKLFKVIYGGKKTKVEMIVF